MEKGQDRILNNKSTLYSSPSMLMIMGSPILPLLAPVSQEVCLNSSFHPAVASPFKEMLPMSFLSQGQFNYHAAQMFSAKNKPVFYEGLHGWFPQYSRLS